MAHWIMVHSGGWALGGGKLEEDYFFLFFPHALCRKHHMKTGLAPRMDSSQNMHGHAIRADPLPQKQTVQLASWFPCANLKPHPLPRGMFDSPVDLLLIVYVFKVLRSACCSFLDTLRFFCNLRKFAVCRSRTPYHMRWTFQFYWNAPIIWKLSAVWLRHECITQLCRWRSHYSLRLKLGSLGFSLGALRVGWQTV